MNDFNDDTDDHLLDATITYGQSAIKGAVVLNGAAAIALIACISNNMRTLQEMTESNGLPLSWAIVIFGVGVFFAVAAFGGSYVSQGAYAHKNDEKGDKWRTRSIWVWVASMLAFVVGSMWSVYYFSAVGI